MPKEQFSAKTIKYSLKEIFEQGINFIDEFHNSGLNNYEINTQDLCNDERIAQRIIPIIETENINPSYVFGMNSPITLGIAIITEYLDTHVDNLMFQNISSEQWKKLCHLGQVIDKNDITII